MTKIKLCGLSTSGDVAAANIFKPDYVGFVFWKKSSRYVGKDTAMRLRSELSTDIQTVGVFVDADIDFVAELLNEGIIDIAQLHGSENDKYISHLREMTDKPIMKAFIVKNQEDIDEANLSPADHILLDAGMGEGEGYVSSGIETDGHKDASKMGSFVANVRLIDAQIASQGPEY